MIYYNTCRVMLVSKIFELLSEETISAFKETSLFRHHFNSELVLMMCDKSCIDFSIYQNTWFYYDIYRYESSIYYSLMISNDRSPEDILGCLIESYLRGTDFSHGSNTVVKVDIRYFKDHPRDLMVKSEYQSGHYELKDYVYWLLQGNKPRYMIVYYDTIAIPDYVICVFVSCNDCANLQTPSCNFIIPDNVLFLITKCPINTDTDRFIAYREVGDFGDHLFRDKRDYVLDEFKKFVYVNFIKSARE